MKYIEIIKNNLRPYYVRVRSSFSKEWKFWYGAKQWYYNWIHQTLDYNNPKSLREKLMWLSRYWQSPLRTEYADKYLVRRYIIQCGYKETLLKLYGVWDDAMDINFSELPDQFVLKCNHGSGYNIICKDKSKLDIEKTISTLNQWKNEIYGLDFYEVHYSLIKPCIYAEQYLPSLESSVIDYKFQCINGEPQFILVCTDREPEKHKVCFSSYSCSWERLDYLKQEAERKIPKPLNLEKMIVMARELAKPFPYVRVDLYEIEGKIYFGELTFTPQGNIMDYYKDEVHEKYGKKLVLPSKLKIKHRYWEMS